MSGLQKISYKNVSGVAIPPHGIVQASGAVTLNPSGDGYVVLVDKVGLGNGPYFIDSGNGAGDTGDARYSECFRAGEGFAWVGYGCGGGPPSPWTQVGPINGSFYVNESGSGYWYAGVYDSDNSRILVMISSLAPQVGTCSSGSGSSISSGSSNRSSSSSSGACPSGCVEVVGDAYCEDGELVVDTVCVAACPSFRSGRV